MINAEDRKFYKIMLFFSIFFFVLELAKQLALYQRFGYYNVWYVPFQLCSMPIWLCPVLAWMGRGRGSAAGMRALPGDRSGVSGPGAPVDLEGARMPGAALGTAICTFLVDYGILGGVAALAVHDGFTFPDAPLLTAHGYVWHVAMLVLAVAVLVWGKADFSLRGFGRAAGLFLGLAFVAFLLCVALHPFGDCDMFYISPYHLSVQPVFHDVDAAIGRGPGIVLYLFAVCFGAGIVHTICAFISSGRVR